MAPEALSRGNGGISEYAEAQTPVFDVREESR
jgi:hypothetical protein